MARFLAIAAFLAVFSLVSADLYMQSPRGCNNRYRGDTNNQNRLFDSQNNAQGGYGWGPQMSYYEGSLLQVEWTMQHGCGQGNMNTDCELIIQYMCGPWIHDGTTDNEAPTNYLSLPLDQQLQYGIHEPPQFYTDCTTRDRNQGLFIADQQIGQDATNTRQNNNNRNGFECAEERDYYPYWHPAPWKDVAVLTSGPLNTRCPYYQAQSQNVQAKDQCLQGRVQPPTYDFSVAANIPYIWGQGAEPNNYLDCQNSGNTWVQVPSWGLPPPDCFTHPLTRDNHLGNTDYGAMTARYLFVIPSNVPVDDPTVPAASQKATCVLRLRYNISSGDYLGYAGVDGTGQNVDASSNGLKSPVKTSPTIMYGLDDQMYYRNLTLRVNTNQYGRTFQDRSHSFFIIKRPLGVPATSRIFNLNVRGKRGNIVQTYPATEYDFTPNNLNVALGDYIHPQWTGSDTNPAGNAGEGTDQTDRSNIVQLSDGGDRRKNIPMAINSVTMFDSTTAFHLAHVDQPPICNYTAQTGCCKTFDQLFASNNGDTNSINQDTQNCQKLNAANAYFNGGLVKMGWNGNTGLYHYMSTRNNNYTNRSQKATIQVQTALNPLSLSLVTVGAAGFVGVGAVAIGVWYAKKHAGSAAANVFGGIRV